MSILNYTDPIIAKNLNKIDEWIKKKKEISKPPFYTSTDIRVSENKVVAVDTNIFPAGFNNCLLYTSPSPRALSTSRMPSSA